MMATMLRQVLDYFEAGQGAVSLPQMARALDLERPMLQTMIDYWVRKGKLREVGAPACSTCGSASGCPFVVAMPRTYERTADDAPAVPAQTGCAHGGSCH